MNSYVLILVDCTKKSQLNKKAQGGLLLWGGLKVKAILCPIRKLLGRCLLMVIKSLVMLRLGKLPGRFKKRRKRKLVPLLIQRIRKMILTNQQRQNQKIKGIAKKINNKHKSFQNHKLPKTNKNRSRFLKILKEKITKVISIYTMTKAKIIKKMKENKKVKENNKINKMQKMTIRKRKKERKILKRMVKKKNLNLLILKNLRELWNWSNWKDHLPLCLQ